MDFLDTDEQYTQPLLLAKFSVDAGFPPGLIQVLSGFGPDVGAALARHMRIRKVGNA